MNKRLLSVLAFALVVSAGAAFVLYQLISSKVQGGSAAAPKTTSVFIAARDLELGALILEKDIRSQEFLTPPTGAITKKEDIVGRGVASPIHQDTPFFEAALAAKGAGAGFASTIPKGMRAFAVHVNEVVGVAGFAIAGMRVDVLVSGQIPSAADSSSASLGSVTRTMLQNIEVLSAGQNYQKDAEGKPVLVQVVNLLVTPQQAEMLNLATENKIQLVLRNPGDREIVVTTGASTAGIFSGGNFALSVSSAKASGAFPLKRRVSAPAPLPVPASAVAPEKAPASVVIEVLAGEKRTEAKVAGVAAGGPQ